MSNFKEELTQAIEDAGQQIINIAEDIAGETTLLRKLDIHVSFDPEYDMQIPTIEVHREYICKEAIDRLNSEDEDKSGKKTFKCPHCGCTFEADENEYLCACDIYENEDRWLT